MKLYKFLNEDGTTPQGYGKWKFPDGEYHWMPEIEGKLIACENGYHLLREQDLVEWFGPVLWECEYRGELLEHDNKVVVRQARLIKQVET